MVEVRKNKKIRLDHIETILKKFRMLDCKLVATPSVVDEKLILDDSPKPSEENKKYITFHIGKLFAAQLKRPNISNAVNKVSRFNKNCESVH